MSNDTPDWNKIRQYLEPKRSEYWIEEPSITQKVFLKSTAQEVLFGGAAGGGKSSALIMAALQYVDVPGYSAILFRPCTPRRSHGPFPRLDHAIRRRSLERQQLHSHIPQRSKSHIRLSQQRQRLPQVQGFRIPIHWNGRGDRN